MICFFSNCPLLINVIVHFLSINLNSKVVLKYLKYLNWYYHELRSKKQMMSSTCYHFPAFNESHGKGSVKCLFNMYKASFKHKDASCPII